MQRIRCEDCGKSYDYDDDAFCPNCGAFNQPRRAARINAAGDVERVDGLSERGHANSFAHEEFHAEEKERRRSGLSRGVDRSVSRAASRKEQPRAATRPVIRPEVFQKQRSGRREGNGSVVPYVVAVIILLNILRACADSL